MENLHQCVDEFETWKIDECKEKAYHRCFGVDPMILEVWFRDKDGTECYFDNWIEIKVNYCPFCGEKSKRNANAFHAKAPTKEVIWNGSK